MFARAISVVKLISLFVFVQCVPSDQSDHKPSECSHLDQTGTRGRGWGCRQQTPLLVNTALNVLVVGAQCNWPDQR